MRDTTLPSPGPAASMGHNLRRLSANAISQVEIVAGKTLGGKTAAAAQLQAFFTACAAALAAYVDTTAPTWAGATATAASATQINIVFAENMDITVKPLPAAFAITGDTITAVDWINATTLRLTGTGFAAAETLNYTKPTDLTYIRDRAGNALATGTKVLV